MHVLIDTSFARRGPSGTQVYTDHLVAALRDLGVEVAEVAGRTGRHLNPAAELRWQVHLARAARGADVLHHPLPAIAPTTVPQVVTVHDLAFLEVPDCFKPRFRRVAARTHRGAARTAAAVVVPSAATAASVRRHWGLDSVVAHHGPGQAPRADRGIPRHFLYVGDEEPRKNLARLRAAHERAETGLPLVEARGGVDVEPLHRHAAALVLPSLHEGFGLPAVEAMHAGTPVIAADIPALREVCQGAARYVDPRDVGAIAQALTDVATVPPLREELRRRGTARAAAFSWRACAEAHVRAYEQAIASRAP